MGAFNEASHSSNVPVNPCCTANSCADRPSLPAAPLAPVAPVAPGSPLEKMLYIRIRIDVERTSLNQRKLRARIILYGRIEDIKTMKFIIELPVGDSFYYCRADKQCNFHNIKPF
ncbi:hypothetical protein BATR1942_06675 [Bacillus atrophaeus 1942]|uniref:Uncharacterized protein n=1 Tax=Bacillus atrophaeus (strain 1942) TaxID=720555 RepID=A0ABM5LWP2_BACA1|nr:hypothetical protein BATR1942_06675 [Bacillus atrophaeus 1942]EIM09053.1 hypothetical protein UY9_19309 [Bacillus atrophaeus C89]MDR4398466.1 hypothetical protein [Bacillus atrophaeus]